jgi:hypothetical protein
MPRLSTFNQKMPTNFKIIGQSITKGGIIVGRIETEPKALGSYNFVHLIISMKESVYCFSRSRSQYHLEGRIAFVHHDKRKMPIVLQCQKSMS